MTTDSFLVATGNVADGFQFVGPFQTADAAAEWAKMAPEAGDTVADWVVVPLYNVGT